MDDETIRNRIENVKKKQLSDCQEQQKSTTTQDARIVSTVWKDTQLFVEGQQIQANLTKKEKKLVL